VSAAGIVADRASEAAFASVAASRVIENTITANFIAQPFGYDDDSVWSPSAYRSFDADATAAPAAVAARVPYG
jgi:hypothetical protein